MAKLSTGFDILAARAACRMAAVGLTAVLGVSAAGELLVHVPFSAAFLMAVASCAACLAMEGKFPDTWRMSFRLAVAWAVIACPLCALLVQARQYVAFAESMSRYTGAFASLSVQELVDRLDNAQLALTLLSIPCGAVLGFLGFVCVLTCSGPFENKLVEWGFHRSLAVSCIMAAVFVMAATSMAYIPYAGVWLACYAAFVCWSLPAFPPELSIKDKYSVVVGLVASLLALCFASLMMNAGRMFFDNLVTFLTLYVALVFFLPAVTKPFLVLAKSAYRRCYARCVAEERERAARDEPAEAAPEAE